MNIRRPTSGMTLYVYRIKANGEREDLEPLQRYEMSAASPTVHLNPPCECARCDRSGG